MHKVCLLTAFIFLFQTHPSLSYAHPGRTDASGCHNDRKNGGYHCHGGGRSMPDSGLRAQPKIGEFYGKTNAVEAGGRCGQKRYCSEMGSCEEAKFYLRSCGLSRLDGDGDGVPCEAVCGR